MGRWTDSEAGRGTIRPIALGATRPSRRPMRPGGRVPGPLSLWIPSGSGRASPHSRRAGSSGSRSPPLIERRSSLRRNDPCCMTNSRSSSLPLSSRRWTRPRAWKAASASNSRTNTANRYNILSTGPTGQRAWAPTHPALRPAPCSLVHALRGTLPHALRGSLPPTLMGCDPCTFTPAVT